MGDTQESGRDRELRNLVRDLNPLEEVQVRLTDQHIDPEVESFTGVVCTVDISVLRRTDSIRIEGKADDLPEPYEWFYLGVWYDIEDEVFESRGVDAFFYNDSRDRVRLPLGDLDGVARRQFREREDVFDDPED